LENGGTRKATANTQTPKSPNRRHAHKYTGDETLQQQQSPANFGTRPASPSPTGFPVHMARGKCRRRRDVQPADVLLFSIIGIWRLRNVYTTTRVGTYFVV